MKLFKIWIRFLATMCCILLVGGIVLLTTGCDNINHDLDSVLNYPGAVVTHLSYVDDYEDNKPVVKYYMRLLRRSPYDETKFEYVDIRVSRYEFERYDIGDTIPENVKPKKTE